MLVGSTCTHQVGDEVLRMLLNLLLLEVVDARLIEVTCGGDLDTRVCSGGSVDDGRQVWCVSVFSLIKLGN